MSLAQMPTESTLARYLNTCPCGEDNSQILMFPDNPLARPQCQRCFIAPSNSVVAMLDDFGERISR